MPAGRIAIPEWEMEWAIGPEGADDETAKLIPARAGVVALQTEDGEMVSLATTADARRFVRRRLGRDEEQEDQGEEAAQAEGVETGAEARSGPPKADLRGLVRRVRLIRAGSTFEADWIYLEHARRADVHGYQLLLDRWRGWFVKIDIGSEHPRLTKTNRPDVDLSDSAEGRASAGSGGGAGGEVHIGPVADKHAAQKMIETLQDVFDLCRYHHLLVQSPDASACAYKEMGRCPAPCDGTVSLASYRGQVEDAVRFAAGGFKRGAEALERDMAAASERMDFEAAASCREKLYRAKPLLRKTFEQVRAVERLGWAAVMPSEKKGFARVMAIQGGSVEAVADVAADAGKARIADVADALERALAGPGDFSEAGIERLGLVCWHLFRNKREKRKGAFIVAEGGKVDAAALKRALGRLARAQAAVDQNAEGGSFAESELDARV